MVLGKLSMVGCIFSGTFVCAPVSLWVTGIPPDLCMLRYRGGEGSLLFLSHKIFPLFTSLSSVLISSKVSLVTPECSVCFLMGL